LEFLFKLSVDTVTNKNVEYLSKNVIKIKNQEKILLFIKPNDT